MATQATAEDLARTAAASGRRQSRANTRSDDPPTVAAARDRSDETSSLRPLRPEGLVDLAYGALRLALLRREFEPGQQLDLSSLSSRLEVSLTPLKEAIRRLASEGLLEVRPRTGTFVRPITERLLTEVMEARMVLEHWALENVADRATTGDWQTLETLLTRSEHVLDDRARSMVGVQDEFTTLDQAFHRHLVASCGNATLGRFFDSLGAHVMLARAWALENPTDLQTRVREGMREHHAILEAIRRRDLPEATGLLDRHVHRSLKRAVAIVTAHGGAI